jgi:hypothetical protein
LKNAETLVSVSGHMEDSSFGALTPSPRTQPDAQRQ